MSEFTEQLGNVVVTKTGQGQIVAVTAQDDDGRVLSVIAESAVVPVEPVAWRWQHNETGRTGFVDVEQLRNGWGALNPRIKIVAPVYAAPAPALTPEQCQELKRLADEMVGAMAREPIAACRGGFSTSRTALHTYIDALGGKE